VLGSALFTGAAIYINLVEHPARMGCGTELAATEFAPSYERAVGMQVPLAVASTVAGVAAWLMTGSILYLIGALLIFSVIPFTLIVIMPTNKRLLDPGRDRSSAETRALLDKWGKLHAVRSVLSLIASSIFLVSILRG
jgi:uncharacterized membrane protein